MKPATAVRERVERIHVSDGRTVLVRHRGCAGVPVVLLHGLLDSSCGWSEICDALNAPTIAVDLAGFGDSSAATAPCLHAYAADVAEALIRLRARRFVLVGRSLGGAVATAVAERMPDEVAALVLLAPAGFGRVPFAEAVSLPVVRTVIDRLLPLALAHPALVRAAYRIAGTGESPPGAALLQTLAKDPVRLWKSARRAITAIVAAGVAADGFHRRIVAYDGPVHLVWGDRDRVVPVGHMAAAQATFPHALPQVWEGIGHHHQCEAPARLVALIEHARAAAALPSIVARRARARGLAAA
jgi:pimeloyl-ACP methyl ester carboxylesterase